MKEQLLDIANKKGLFQSPEWLSDIKNEALATASSLDIPSTKHEEWKFTNLATLNKTTFSLNENQEIDIQSVLIKGMDVNYAVILNGQFSESLSKLNPNQAIVKSFKKALTENKEDIQVTYSKHLNSKNEIFSAQNTAFANDGVFIKIPKGKIEEAPLYVYVITDASQNDVFSLTRNLVIAEEGSIAKTVFIPVSVGGNKSFQNIVTEVEVQSNTNFELNILQNDSKNASQVNTTQVNQHASSVFTSNVISLKGNIIRNNTNLVLNGEHIEGHMNGLYLLDGKTHVDNHTVADHKYPNCESHELYKGIVDDKSRGVFNGKIFVRQDAQKTNAFQQNNNILLSDEATINTKPQLEIWADDVSCSHGATIGQLDKEALFFLRSRGIGLQKAKAILTQAFANEVTARLTIEPLKEHVLHLIDERLS